MEWAAPIEVDLTSLLAGSASRQALVWLTDVAGLERVAAAELMRWSAHQLLRAAL